MATVFRKTAKGSAEIETRAHRLLPRLRSALILVDGKRTDDDLSKLILQDPALPLQTLFEGGFIDAVATVAATPAPAPRAAPAPAAAAAPNFEQTRRDAVRGLTDLIGPLGEALALRMEKTRNMGELQALLVVAVQVIGNTRGRQAAADYGTRFGADAG